MKDKKRSEPKRERKKVSGVTQGEGIQGIFPPSEALPSLSIVVLLSPASLRYAVLRAQGAAAGHGTRYALR